MGILRIKMKGRMAPEDRYRTFLDILGKFHVKINEIITHEVPGEEDFFENEKRYSIPSDVHPSEKTEVTVFGVFEEALDICIEAVLHNTKFSSALDDIMITPVKDSISLVELYETADWFKERLKDVISNHNRNIKSITLAETVYDEDMMKHVFYWKRDIKDVADDFITMLEEDAKRVKELEMMLKPYRKAPIVNALAGEPFKDYLMRQGKIVNIAVESGSLTMWGTPNNTVRELYERFRDHFVDHIGKNWITEEKMRRLFEEWLSENRPNHKVEEFAENQVPGT